MKAKRLVEYNYFKAKGCLSWTFGDYKNEHGELVEFKNMQGTKDVVCLRGSSVILDLDNRGHKNMDDFLKNNPDVLAGKWIRTDLHQQEAEETKATLDSARAIIEAAKMTDREVKQFATLKRMNLNSEMDVLRAKIITIAQNDSESFMDVHFDPEKDLRVFIIEAVRERKLNYKNDTFYYGKEAIGTNEEQVLVWLKDNKDILAILKHEIRGESKSETKTVKIED